MKDKKTHEDSVLYWLRLILIDKRKITSSKWRLVMMGAVLITSLAYGFLIQKAVESSSLSIYASILGVVGFMTLLLLSRIMEEKNYRAEADNVKAAAEFEQARNLQLSLLPREIPKHPELELGVKMVTATEVGGDYYDFFESDSGFYIVIGDAAGHGISAGMMVAMTKGALAAAQSNEPAELMNELSCVMQVIHVKSVFMALNILKYHNEQLTICSAGMPPVFMIRSGSGDIEEIEIPGLPLGSRLSQNYTSQTLPFLPGDALILFSDGLVEVPNESGEIPGYPGVRDWIREQADSTVQSIVDGLFSSCEEWSSGDFPDDVTVVVLSRKSRN